MTTNFGHFTIRGTRTAVVLVWVALLLIPLGGGAAATGPLVDVIVQGVDVSATSALVRSVGGTVTSELPIIRAVSASVPEATLTLLGMQPGIRRIWLDQVVASSGTLVDTAFPRVVNAPPVWAAGVRGKGVTVAVLDTGATVLMEGLRKDTGGLDRIAAYYDAITNVQVNPWTSAPNDNYGHGSHVTGVIAGSEVTLVGQYAGVAPDARLVIVRALGDNGSGTYAQVIRGIDWVVANKDTLGIRVLNLSLSGKPQSHYWDDPLNQAVMRAWQAGIVVVAAAGNTGPNPMTIGVPGNVPYVITVGAMSDNHTPDDPADDFLTAFSAAGPTVEGFVKPEVVAPGGHNISTMKNSTSLATTYGDYRVDAQHFQMSGTSMATAVTSGIVALMLQRDPGLTPDEVKCRLMASADPAVDRSGVLAYSIFQQGAGQVDAYQAVYSTASGCANQGLNVDNDLAGIEHYGGRANQDASGNYYIMGIDGYAWSGGYAWSDAYAWSEAYAWSDGYAWSSAYAWSDGYAWSAGYVWSEGYAWSSTEITAHTWVTDDYVSIDRGESRGHRGVGKGAKR